MSSFIKTNGALSLALGAMTILSVAAVAQSTSPFAKKNKKQAWETDAARPAANTPSYQAPSYTAPAYKAPQYMPPPGYRSPSTASSAPVVSSPTVSSPTVSAPTVSASSSSASSYSAPSYSAPSYSAPSYSAPTAAASVPTSSAPTSSSGYSAPSYSSASTYSAPTYSAPSTAPSPAAPTSYTGVSTSAGSYTPPTSSYSAPQQLPGYQNPTQKNNGWKLGQSGQSGAYYPGRENGGGYSVPARAPRYSQKGAQNQAPQNHGAPNQRAQNQAAANSAPSASPFANRNYRAPSGQVAQNQAGQYQGQQTPQGYGANTTNHPSSYAKRSWKDRLGLGNLATTFNAFLKVGVAALNRKNTATDSGWRESFIADGKIAGEVSAITGGGLEYGLGGEVRGQYDRYRLGFGGQVGDCGAGTVTGVIGCNSVVVDGAALPLRGHTSQFYNSGIDVSEKAEFALEGAYLFLRSAYGDLTIGRDDGAAYLFSLGAPSLLAVNASNSPVDYTGLDSVRTVNEASGFSEKIAYVSPRLLGDSIGVGVQIGASYAPNARSCGVDYCVKANGRDGSTALSPDLDDVLEFGIALDRTFANGLRVEGTATYATASEQSGLQLGGEDVFDNLKSLGLGLEAEYGAWKIGGSYLNSNNGLQDGDYEAYDVGLTWKPAQWGVSASYGHATDKNVNLLSDQATLGFVYDFDRFTLGTGVQYIERDVLSALDTLVVPSTVVPRKEKGTALFIEAAVKF